MKSFERPWKPSSHTQKVLIKMFKPSKKYPTRDTVPLSSVVEPSVMMCCASGSDFRKVWFRFRLRFRFRFRIHTIFSTVFQQPKVCTKSCFFRSEAELFPRKMASHFLFFLLLYCILCWIPVPISLRQKSSGSCGSGSGSTTAFMYTILQWS